MHAELTGCGIINRSITFADLLRIVSIETKQQQDRTYTGWPKKVSHRQSSKKCIKSYCSQAMILDLFVKLKHQPGIIILSLGIKYSARDQLCDVVPDPQVAICVVAYGK